MLSKVFEEFLKESGLRSPSREERNGGCIWNRVDHSKAAELLERTPIADLEFRILNRKLKASPTLRLTNCCNTSMLHIMNGSIFSLQALLCAHGHSRVPAWTKSFSRDLIRSG
jgi:hypothetical protein